jgi:SAM-dependent methyltransferase
MKESSKTKLVRSKEFFDTYFNGKIIDIGGGTDPVTENAEVFDFEQGDAQHILKYKDKESYDCVNSSHCLEHMKDVPLALSQWWELVKPGGYMIIVVPHEDLYEQKIWPSVFATDVYGTDVYGHAATFRLKTEDTWSPVSYDIFELASTLASAQVIHSEIQDLNYDYSLLGKRLGPGARKIYKWRRSKNKIKKITSEFIYKFLHDNFWIKSNNQSGIPIDQTTWNALAQIQIVIKKLD